MKTFTQLVENALKHIEEVFPWDLEEQLNNPHEDMILLDVREADEFNDFHIQGSLNAPRGILETCCEYGFEETIPTLANARNTKVVIICRSGNRSALAAHTMQMMGFEHLYSVQTGIRGWNDYELPLYNGQGEIVDIDRVDEQLGRAIPAEKLRPQ
jgi:rhodanese-related sulfurtransferase